MKGLTRKWKPPPPTNPTSSLQDRILEARGIATTGDAEAFLNPTLLQLDDPDTLPGAIRAGELLAEALRANKKILIFGDYDADGITASAVLYHIISAAIGREGPTIYIPDRIDEGYGIRVAAIEKFAKQGVDLVITVDCGITAVDAARRAEELGVTLIITDHHKPREDGELPECAAIVHPGLEDHPQTPFAGVGVAYQVAWSFARQWSESQTVNTRLKQTLLDMIPIVAIGTIADMVPLINGNRIFARWGLQLLPSTTNPGLRAIMKELETPSKKLNSAHISFGIAPLINAVGRLSQAAQAVDLLTHLEGELATGAAKNLANLNRKRQGIQRRIISEALAQFEEEQLHDSPIVILKNKEWERGVAGVAAGKCIETNYKPTILLTEDGDELVGSARSISGFSIFNALCACQNFLVTFGGHDMAAGLSLQKEKFDAFVSAMTTYAGDNIDPELFVATVKPDVMADLHEITHTLAVEIEKIGPFGIGNPNPIVQIMSAKISEVRAMGKEGTHLSFRAGNKRIRCIWWGQGDLVSRIANGSRIDFVGKIKMNEFRGHSSAEIDILDIALPSS
ncbi:MAG: single-stranded-DNA-specific exonuclease RecJ [Phycisphaerae bacterium]|jgi:single-stranded-DNA-specific exonuclease|nr:single-stranded-DNA-specific exonuclease RecJ [Phycisphaerae bacterium]